MFTTGEIPSRAFENVWSEGVQWEVFVANMEAAYERVRDKMGHQLDRQKELYDQKVHGRPLEPGDLVWLHCPAVPKGQSWKIHKPWNGPYRVVT